jgi:glycerol-3-phosphate dehydrogenase
LGKGVLCQTTLWGNLILGPTARDVYKAEAREMSPAAIQEYILSKCKRLIPHFDAKESFHAFCGARAKSTRGDWIIEHSAKNKRMILVAGIDSPGLAGSPASMYLSIVTIAFVSSCFPTLMIMTPCCFVLL